ncbi:DUF6259 domain-containing protein [Lederbergia sp. NSJ-179]|uniref:DUF6259 domain-containing protein n=1 Tax=Lederbergia sp. NSJ-179 TaxID=2931402 RepID=UPI001FD4D24C|nr:DUF6259 domain-containing protein [Lederbergia sp. NSJ-179]MCJ7842143.1 DUF6259 domain-containing protein [Lederbergia sp. NSJ-179]
MYTIGYDFKDSFVSLDGLSFSLRLFTEVNAYAPDPEKVTIEDTENGVRLHASGLAWAGGQKNCDGEVEMTITRGVDGRYIVRGSGKHPKEICKSILLQVYGINVISIQFDQNKTSTFEFNRDIRARHYPKDIKMPLVFVEDRLEQHWFALSKDDKLRAKGFASHYDPFLEAQILDIAHEEDKRYRSHTIQMPEWHIGTCVKKESIIKERCLDLEKNFDLVPFTDRKDTPEWLNEIKLVTILHGEHWTGHVFNTFADMEKILEWITKRIDGSNVLAFLPGWDGRYYYNYPEYQPSKDMGGAQGFQRLVKKAHDLGVKVVPMLGANNANIEVIKQLGLENIAMKDTWGHEVRCDWVDWDYDLFIENNCILANMGHPDFLKYMIDKSSDLIHSYGVDGIFLDISRWWENDPNYSPYEGLVEWAKEMKRLHPETLLFGENSYDVLWGIFSLFHERKRPGGHGAALYRYARQTHYLAYPAPGKGSGGIHEYAWNENGFPWERDIPELIPTLSIVEDTISNHKQATELLIEKAKSWVPVHPGII